MRMDNVRFQCSAARRGYSLVEMLVSVMICSMVIPLGAMVVQRVWRIDRQLREQVQARQTLARLSNRFRQDIRGAVRAEVDGDTIRLDLGQRKIISYVARDGAIDRQVTTPGKVEHRDQFRLEAGSRAAFVVEPLEDRRLARLLIARHDATLPPVANLEALVGLHQEHPQ